MENEYLFKDLTITLNAEGKANYDLPCGIQIEHTEFQLDYPSFPKEQTKKVSIFFSNATGTGAGNDITLLFSGRTNFEIQPEKTQDYICYSVKIENGTPGDTIYLTAINTNIAVFIP